MKAELCRERPLCWILTFIVVWNDMKIFHTFNVMYLFWCVHTYTYTHDTIKKTKVLCISITSSIFFVRTLTWDLSSYYISWMHNIILLTTGTMLYSKFLELTHFAYQKLYIHWKTPISSLPKNRNHHSIFFDYFGWI